jgi:hypothetical protein
MTPKNRFWCESDHWPETRSRPLSPNTRLLLYSLDDILKRRHTTLPRLSSYCSVDRCAAPAESTSTRRSRGSAWRTTTGTPRLPASTADTASTSTLRTFYIYTVWWPLCMFFNGCIIQKILDRMLWPFYMFDTGCPDHSVGFTREVHTYISFIYVSFLFSVIFHVAFLFASTL